MSIAIGIDIGGTNVKCVVVKPDGALIESRAFPTGDATNAWAGTVARAVSDLEHSFGKAEAIGVSSPGLAARDQRTIAWMQGRMAGVQGFDWTKHLQRSTPVPVLNDAHAALLGEAWIGAAAGCRNVVLLTLGTGVGGAVMCDGRLLTGHLGRAGHLGHISLDPNGALDIVKTPGSLEDAVGDHTIAQRTHKRFLSTADLVRAAHQGDADAERIWTISIRHLAAGLTSIINAVDPEIVVLGGGIAKAGDDLFIPLQSELDRIEWRPMGAGVRLVPARLGDLAGAYGAARNALPREERT